MRTIGVCAIAIILLGGAAATADPPAHAKGKKQKQAQSGAQQEQSSIAVHVSFISGDVTIIRSHYAPRYRNLPPGLQKKVARGGQLPPGWQKKFEPFPYDLERRLQPLPQGYRRGVIDGHAVIYDSGTHVMVDVAVLF